MFANCQSGGMDKAPADVCHTPPLGIPMPYPNEAYGPDAYPNITNIIYVGGAVHNLNTVIRLSHHDDPGAFLGVFTKMVKGWSIHTTGANKVVICGAPITRVSSCSMTNAFNAPGSRVLPSQTKILILAG